MLPYVENRHNTRVGETTLVTGGSGYIGALLVRELGDAGTRSGCSTRCCTARRNRRASWSAPACELIRGDVRDAARASGARGARRGRAPRRDRRRSGLRARPRAVATRSTSRARRALVADARRPASSGFVFASTCSNYGRMADPTVPIDEDGELRPVSLYAEQKVGDGAAAARRAARRALEADLPALRHRLRRRRRGCAST